MLINGQEALDSVVGILGQLAILPSAFPDYITSTMTIRDPALDEKEKAKYEQEGKLYDKLYRAGCRSFAQDDFEGAIALLLKAEKALPPSWQDSYLLVRSGQVIAKCYESLDMYPEAIKKLDKIIEKAASNVGNYDDLKICCDLLVGVLISYSQQNSTSQQTFSLELYKKEAQNYLDKYKAEPYVQGERDSIKARLILGAICKYEGKHAESIQHYDKADLLNQGMFDYEAHNILQHEVGFSADEKIGTTDLQQCVAVILRDPVTHYTALAHVDEDVRIDSLSNEVISKFPTDRQLDAYLVGGRGKDETSKKNITKVVEELKKYPLINIKVADLGDRRLPQAVVFNPLTTQIIHKVPAKIDNNIYKRWANVHYNPSFLASKLHFAFDLKESRYTGSIIQLPPEAQENVIWQLFRELIINNDNKDSYYYFNTRLVPLVKAAEEIRENNPRLLIEVTVKQFKKVLDTRFMSENDKESLAESFQFYSSKLINDKTKPFFETFKLMTEDIFSGIFDKDTQEVYRKIRNAHYEHISRGVKLEGSNIQGLNSSSHAPLDNASTTRRTNNSKQQFPNKQELNR
ncbi:hypothetical protein Bhyg_00189 [Pseudolycoriella hygida]|uniref:Tetratricopeptide repeat protein n=1 Tax=Pseudolycoriella hygida TaxID=35572 RepID=A0A9Q0S4C6_9DIPT|nr:hypothetical protein Bhyg_00189 [Pseudolycoriella hygida]